MRAPLSLILGCAALALAACDLPPRILGGTTTTGPSLASCAGIAAGESDYAKLGQGTPSAPHVLCTAAQLNGLAFATAAWAQAFALGADIDMSAYPSASPIGTNTTPFTGTFDGAGHTVSNFQINQPTSAQPVGLFGSVIGSAAVIENLTVATTAAGVVGQSSVGVLAGLVKRAMIINCSTSGQATGNVSVGGAVGALWDGAVISSSSSSAVATGVPGVPISINIGGLVGFTYNAVWVTNSYATGEVSGDSVVGGLIGANYKTNFLDDYATGNVSANSGAAGGFAGDLGYSNAVNCFATGSVVAAGSGAGTSSSFAALNSSSGTNCYYYDAGPAHCTVAGGACAVDPATANSTLADFYSPSFAPLSAWDFSNYWVAQSGSFPSLAPKLFDYTAWGGCAAHVKDTTPSGMGSAESPYLVCAPTQLLALANLKTGFYARLMTDLDLTDLPLRAPIAFPLFDGGGHTISNLTVSDNDPNDWAALFTNVNGGVRRLGVVNADVSNNAGPAAAVIAGTGWEGALSDCYADGATTVTAAGAAYGLAGDQNDGVVVDSYSAATVTSTANLAVGLGAGNLTDSFSAATVAGVAVAGVTLGGPIGRYQSSSNVCEPDSVQVSQNDYYDETTTCAGCCMPDAYGTAEPSSYFYAQSDAPMNVWDFVNVWQSNANAYPTLRSAP